MPPPVPASIPAALPSILSSIRSQIFMTTHNPTGARLGNKYLRKNLVGPTINSYYPKPLPKWNAWSNRLLAAEKERKDSWLAKGGDRRMLAQWEATSEIAPGYEAVERTHYAKGVTSLFWDAREDKRLRRVERRKRIGKGPPKKGEGKRSQMGAKGGKKR